MSIWAEAKCRGLDTAIFFPERGDYWGVKAAKAICAECPIQVQCLKANMHEGEGIWGGASSRERKNYRGRNKERLCALCQTTFTLVNNGQAYCGDTCRAEGKRLRNIEEKRRRRANA